MSKRPYRFWTTKDHRTILQYMETHSNKEIALMIGTTADGVARYCKKHRLMRSKEYIRNMNIANLKKHAPQLPPLETK